MDGSDLRIAVRSLIRNKGFALASSFTLALRIYSVVASSTLQRTAEIGVRMALGARSGDVIRMVVQQGATLALAGTALGIAAAYFATGALAAFIHGVTTTDPFSFGAAGATLVVVAMAASYIPARRAALVDPAIALREE